MEEEQIKTAQELLCFCLLTRESRIAAGLGMAAYQSIVSQHKGRLQVESSSGKGTTFTVILPVIG